MLHRRIAATLLTLAAAGALGSALAYASVSQAGDPWSTGPGGVMPQAGVVKVEHGEVGIRRDGRVSQDFVDPAPIVLWDGARPAAIVTLREKGNELLGWVTQTFAVTSGRHGPFPISATLSIRGKGAAKRYDLGQIHPVDLQGAGPEALVLLRESGAVEVHGLKKTLAHLELPATGLVRYAPLEAHRARVGGRDVLYLPLVRRVEGAADEATLARSGAADRSVLLRVDAAGISRLELGEAGRSSDLMAVAAVNRPGSQVVDELLLLCEREGAVFLSRHRPDGAPLDVPRKVPVSISTGRLLAFAFLPGTAHAVAYDQDRAYFIQADEPASWIHAVDLAPLQRRGDGQLRLLGVLDPLAPKVVAQVGEQLFAVDQDGTYHGPGLIPATGPAKATPPFLTLAAPVIGQRLIGVFGPDGGGPELLAVYSRPGGYRELSFEETMAAAERYLPAVVVAHAKAHLEPTLGGPSADHLIEQEQERRKVADRPTTLEEWKRLFPDSYAERREQLRLSVLVSLRSELRQGANPEARLGDYPDIPGLEAFMAGLAQPAETSFELYRHGGRVAAGTAPGYLEPGGESRVDRRQVAFRASGAEATVVLALEPPGAAPGGHRQLHVVKLGVAR